MKNLLKKHVLFLGIFILFCLLLFKDPFSERTLIPNLEPYPDALYYVTSARSFLQGHGLAVGRDNRFFPPPIPPLYSLSLTPLFILNSDPRVFYFTNVILALVSLILFYKILILIIDNMLIRGFILFLYVTNYFIYWFPTLAMAENMTLVIFLSFLLVLLLKIHPVRIILAAALGVGFYATKYASVPLAVTSLTLYFLKLLADWKRKKIFTSNIFLFIGAIAVFFMAFFAYESLAKGKSPFSSLIAFIFFLHPPSDQEAVISATPWFSLNYISTNIWHYLNSITGGSERFLWDATPLIPAFVGIGGILGIAVGLVVDRFRFISLILAVSLISSILFISTLYTYDMRYIYTAIPSLLLGFGIFLSALIEKIKKKPFKLVILLVIGAVVVYYGFTNAIRIKSQISLNLRYAETPWYYVSVLKLNKYFTPDKMSNGKKPIVVSALPPYLVDFYSNGNYTLLPLSYQQEFRNNKEIVWGPNDYSNLPKLYEKYLKEGFDVYMARYGLGNEGYTNKDFQTTMVLFNSRLVLSGCYEQCNIYKLTLKDHINN